MNMFTTMKETKGVSRDAHNEQSCNASRQIRATEKRIAELEHLLKKLYEDYALGKIPESRFEALAAGYEKEQSDLRRLLAEAEAELVSYQNDTDNIDRFMKAIQKYRNPNKLTAPMLNELIEKIIVHAPKKQNGQRSMQVDVIFRFIGNFTVPRVENAA